ncbi:phasin family protein [Aestuariivita boseongensis]|uniref:phasin family protein n=1 Tax=Aestuariivita boseongensis TaxID=1470562 RepID=UPI00155DCB9A|nr:phasin family protein [Aestuariivita boseongensis]
MTGAVNDPALASNCSKGGLFMAKSTKKSAADKDNPFAMSAAMMAINPASMQAWQEVMTECSRFVMDRLQQDFETQQAILGCKSPAELVQLQTEFYQNAIKQYSEETMRLMQMMSDAAGTAVSEAQSSTKRRYDDVPL